MATHAAYGFYPEEFLDLARTSSDIEAVKGLLTAASTEGMKPELFDDESNEDYKEEYKSKSRIEPSESRVEGSWLDADRGPFSFFEDQNENDALHSRENANSNKREEYYEGLEKKSLRSHYALPPRKTFYASDMMDSSVSEESISEETPTRRTPIRIEHQVSKDTSEEDDSVIHAESHPLIEALQLAAHAHPHMLHLQRPMQVQSRYQIYDISIFLFVYFSSYRDIYSLIVTLKVSDVET